MAMFLKFPARPKSPSQERVKRLRRATRRATAATSASRSSPAGARRTAHSLLGVNAPIITGKPTNPRKPLAASGTESDTSACGEALGDSTGCVQGDTHVFKVTSPARLASIVPFVETPPNELAS